MVILIPVIWILSLTMGPVKGGPSCSKGCSLNTTSVVEVLVNSGMALSEAVNNFNKAEVNPAIEDLNERIRNLNLEAAGISTEKVPEYKKSLQEFSDIRKGLKTMRIILIALARETITRADSLLRLMKVVEDKPEKAGKGLKFASKAMVKLIDRSKLVLDEAEDYLKQANARLSDIDANMVVLKHKLDSKFQQVERKLNENQGRRRKREVCENSIDPQCNQPRAMTHERAEMENKVANISAQIDVTYQRHEAAIKTSQNIEEDWQKQLEVFEKKKWEIMEAQKLFDLEDLEDSEDLDTIWSVKESVFGMATNLKEACQNYLY